MFTANWRLFSYTFFSLDKEVELTEKQQTFSLKERQESTLNITKTFFVLDLKD